MVITMYVFPTWSHVKHLNHAYVPNGTFMKKTFSNMKQSNIISVTEDFAWFSMEPGALLGTPNVFS